jgi:hypothetical protein
MTNLLLMDESFSVKPLSSCSAGITVECLCIFTSVTIVNVRFATDFVMFS